MRRKHFRHEWAVVLPLCIGACYSGAGAGPSGTGDADSVGSGADTGGGESAGDSAGGDGPGSVDSGPPDGCLPGAVGCTCLDGACSGFSVCLENICVPSPPMPDVEGPTAVLAGASVIVSGQVDGGDDNDNDSLYEMLQWSQVEGPTAVISDEYAEETRVYLAADADDGAAFSFRLTASLGDVTASSDVMLSVLPAMPTGVMDDAAEILALGASVAARADGNNFWLATPTGTLVLTADGGMVGFMEDLGSPIAAIVPSDDGQVLLALPGLQQVSAYNPNNQMIAPLLTELTGGQPLGAVSSIAVFDGDIYLGTDEGTIIYYDDADDAEPAVTLALHTLTSPPTALAIGEVPVPLDVDEGEEGLVLYCGTAAGDVVQIGLTAVEFGEGPALGMPTPFISVPGAGAITGLAIDDQSNLWVAKGDALHLVRRPYDDAPSIVRTIQAPAGLRGFGSLRSDGGNGLTWIDATTSRVARMDVYQ